MKRIINPFLHLEGYNCFGCAPQNPLGVKLEFFEDGEDIVSYWQPTSPYQGWFCTLHGGIQSVLLDEICGWVVMRKLQTGGVTSKWKRAISAPYALTAAPLRFAPTLRAVCATSLPSKPRLQTKAGMYAQLPFAPTLRSRLKKHELTCIFQVAKQKENSDSQQLNNNTTI